MARATKGSGGRETLPPDANPGTVVETTASQPAPPTTEAYVVPSAAPPLSDDASITRAPTAGNDRPLLIAGGLALALVAVGMFLVVSLARRRYSDRLLR